MSTVEVVSVEEVSFRYNSTEVLTDISFRLRGGDYVGIVGPNGSGKSTLIKAILGLLQPSKGRIALFGQRLEEFTDWHRVGYLPQKINGFNPHFPATVREIVGLGLLSGKNYPRRITRKDERAIDKALSLVESREIKGELIGELSGGQQQRVLIARALVSEPELLILDEPTTALDPETRERFFNTLRSLNEEKGITLMIITHDIGTIGKYASRLLYLDKRVVFFGGFDDFCASSEMATYFGEYSQHVICHRHDK